MSRSESVEIEPGLCDSGEQLVRQRRIGGEEAVQPEQEDEHMREDRRERSSCRPRLDRALRKVRVAAREEQRGPRNERVEMGEQTRQTRPAAAAGRAVLAVDERLEAEHELGRRSLERLAHQLLRRESLESLRPQPVLHDGGVGRVKHH